MFPKYCLILSFSIEKKTETFIYMTIQLVSQVSLQRLVNQHSVGTSIQTSVPLSYLPFSAKHIRRNSCGQTLNKTLSLQHETLTLGSHSSSVALET